MALRRNSVALLAGVAALAACGQPEPPAPRPVTIGLSTSLPIYWSESDDLSGMLAGDAGLPWPRQLIEQDHRLIPLDSLSGDGALEGVEAVLLVQPRPLPPADNVALDQWVRAGGHALVFADPALTQDSVFPLGDKRRPQDVALLSPILSRWGLALEFDEAQPAGERLVDDAIARALPINLAGRLRPVAGAADPGDRCTTGPEALVARCRIGRGTVTLVADAALFEPDGEREVREQALERLIDSLARDVAGSGGENRGRGVGTGQNGPDPGSSKGENAEG